MVFFKLLVISLYFLNTFCLESIFKHFAIEVECTTSEGKVGVCHRRSRCEKYEEMVPKYPSHCFTNDGRQGTCCTASQNEMEEISNISSSAMRYSSKKGMKRARKMDDFKQNLAERQIVSPVNSPMYMHQRFFHTTDDILQKGKDADVVLETTKVLMSRMKVGKEQIQKMLSEFDVKETPIGYTCPRKPICHVLVTNRYRTLDGSCNNLKYTDWGQFGVAFNRLIPQEYDDMLSTLRKSVTKKDLPSPRLVSTTCSPNTSDLYTNVTTLLFHFGQFLDHDITFTPNAKGDNVTDISCCKNGKMRPLNDRHPDCMPFEILKNDKFYSKFNQRCMDFVRSLPAVRSNCKLGPREQMNQVTAYIDASNVYGSTDKESQDVRKFQDGLLKVTEFDGRELLPGLSKKFGCIEATSTHQCFLAGDRRANIQQGLTIMHLLFMRHHNKIVRKLAIINPSWDDEKLYQEGRRIVGAQLQHITYKEYLPALLGEKFVKENDLIPLLRGHFRGYRQDVDATLFNSFSAAASRFGHTLITSKLESYNDVGILNDNLDLAMFQFMPFVLYKQGMLDSLIRGTIRQRSQKFDPFFVKEMTTKLFARNPTFGLDLLAINIQRGRDQGIPAYPKFRKVCGLPAVNSWNDLQGVMESEAIWNLENVYESVHDIDLFMGGISEKIAPGAAIGPTFQCIIGRQFYKLKFGDRFYYENGGIVKEFPWSEGERLPSFTQKQLREIRKTTLAAIICENSDNLKSIQINPFFTKSYRNKDYLCKSGYLKRINLNRWKQI